MKTEHKALTLLEWRLKLKQKENAARAGLMLEDSAYVLYGEIEKSYAADAFYSQPFTPELIPGMFEGWELAEDKKQAWIPNIPFDPTHWMEMGNYLVIHIDNLDEYEVSYKPTTLADFISDCHRAGLSLTWKPEVLTANPFLR